LDPELLPEFVEEERFEIGDEDEELLARLLKGDLSALPPLPESDGSRSDQAQYSPMLEPEDIDDDLEAQEEARPFEGHHEQLLEKLLAGDLSALPALPESSDGSPKIE